MNPILTVIEEKYPQLSAMQKKIADYILANDKKAAFLNSIELAEAIGVSNPTIIRFAVSLGFSGFPQFQETLQKVIQNKLSSLERLDYLKEDTKEEWAGNVFQLELQNIMAAYQILPHDKITDAVNLLNTAAFIYIAGLQISSTIANFAEYSLKKVRKNIRNISAYTMDDDDSLRENYRNSCALVIALPRYPRKTLHILKQLYEMDMPVVLITDSEVFPYLHYAKIHLFTAFKYVSFIDPIAVPVCLINSLILGLANANLAETSQNLNKFEDYVVREEVYFNNNGGDEK